MKPDPKAHLGEVCVIYIYTFYDIYVVDIYVHDIYVVDIFVFL